MTTEKLIKIKTKALMKGNTARGASINETLVLVDTINKMTGQFVQIADTYELCGASVFQCNAYKRKYPVDWVINDTCPFCLKEHPSDMG
jgi:hypothetical protein